MKNTRIKRIKEFFNDNINLLYEDDGVKFYQDTSLLKNSDDIVVKNTANVDKIICITKHPDPYAVYVYDFPKHGENIESFEDELMERNGDSSVIYHIKSGEQLKLTDEDEKFSVMNVKDMKDISERCNERRHLENLEFYGGLSV